LVTPIQPPRFLHRSPAPANSRNVLDDRRGGTRFFGFHDICCDYKTDLLGFYDSDTVCDDLAYLNNEALHFIHSPLSQVLGPATLLSSHYAEMASSIAWPKQEPETAAFEVNKQPFFYPLIQRNLCNISTLELQYFQACRIGGKQSPLKETPIC